MQDAQTPARRGLRHEQFQAKACRILHGATLVECLPTSQKPHRLLSRLHRVPSGREEACATPGVPEGSRPAFGAIGQRTYGFFSLVRQTWRASGSISCLNQQNHLRRVCVVRVRCFYANRGVFGTKIRVKSLDTCTSTYFAVATGRPRRDPEETKTLHISMSHAPRRAESG